MPTPRMTMRAIQEVIRLHAAGFSQRQIAQACRLSKGAVGKYLQKAEQASVSWPLPPEMDPAKLEAQLFPGHRSATVTAPVMPDFAAIHTEMRRKGMTLQLLWEEYVAAHDEQRVYQYSQFCTHYRAWKGRLKRSMRQNHLAGDKLFIDYAGPTVPVIDPGTGEIRQAQIFVAVLGASSYTYCEATWSQSLSDFLGSHVRALRYFGGAPVLLVPDNLKAAVTKASRYEPQINRSYQDLATHYGAVVLPTRPYKPKDKESASDCTLFSRLHRDKPRWHNMVTSATSPHNGPSSHLLPVYKPAEMGVTPTNRTSRILPFNVSATSPLRWA